MSIQRPSCEYYAFARLPYENFKTISAIYALFDQITRIPDEVSEPSIAHQKCLFYQTDIGKMHQQAATHPVCIAVQGSASCRALVDWQPIITATQMDIDRIIFYNNDDFKRYAHKKYGALYQLIARCLNQVDPTACNALGYFVAEIIRLQRLRNDLLEQQHIPRNLTTQYHIEPWQLEQHQGHLQPLIAALIQQAVDNAELPLGLPQELRILHRLYRDILSKMQAAPTTLLTTHVDSTPIKKLILSRFHFIHRIIS